MEWIVNFFNRTVDIGSWLISCIAIYVVMLPAVLMPLIMGQQLLFFNKKSFKVPKSDAFLLDLVAKMPRSAKLKGLNLRYPIAWRDFLLKNTMSTGKLRNVMFKISHFWDEKRPTKKSEDRIPTMLLPASPQPAIPRPALKDFWNNRRQESVPFVLKVHPSSPSRLSVHGRSDELLKQSAWEAMPFVSKVHPSGPSRTSVHGQPPQGPLWQTSETIGVRNSCRLFQKSIPAARHGRPSTARPHGPLWRTSETIGVGSFAIRFKSPSQRPVTDVRPRPAPPRPALTDFWNNRREELVPFVSKVHPSGPSRTAVHGPPPRPALTDFWNNRRGKLCHSFQKSIPAARHGRPSTARPPRPALTDFWNNRREELVPFVSKVHPSGPSRTAVHGPPPRPALTDFWNNRRGKLCHSFQKSIPAVRHGRPSTASPPRPALTDFWNNRREELVPFVSKVHPSGPSRTAVHGPPPTARSDRLLKQSAWGTRAVCFKSPSQRPVTDGRPRPAPHGPLWQTSETIGVRNSCRLFQKSIPAARHGRPSTARPHGPLWRTSETIGVGSFAIRFKSPSQRPVTDVRPRPAPHGPLWWTSETIGVRNSCRLFQKSIPAARHGRPSTARPHGPLWRTSETFGARNPCHLFQKSIPAARHGQPSTVRSHGQLWQTFETFGVRNPPYQFFFESPSQRPVKAVRPRPALTARSDSHSESNLYWKLLFLQEY